MRDFVYLILKRRHIALTVLRLTSFVMCLWGFIALSHYLCTAFLNSRNPFVLSRGPGPGPVIMNLLLIAIGITIGMTNQRLAKWLVPLPRKVCPKCDYRLIRLQQPRCPECGLDLPNEYVEEKGNPENR